MEARMQTSRSTLLVDVGDQLRVVEDRVKAGSYASPDEVVQAALRALEREESETQEWLVQLAEESLADPGPSIPAAEVFAEIYVMHHNGNTNSVP
jgi:antitoxin ParD1/3/4